LIVFIQLNQLKGLFSKDSEVIEELFRKSNILLEYCGSKKAHFKKRDAVLVSKFELRLVL